MHTIAHARTGLHVCAVHTIAHARAVLHVCAVHAIAHVRIVLHVCAVHTIAHARTVLHVCSAVANAIRSRFYMYDISSYHVIRNRCCSIANSGSGDDTFECTLHLGWKNGLPRLRQQAAALLSLSLPRVLVAVERSTYIPLGTFTLYIPAQHRS